MNIPLASYRLQFIQQFRFKDAQKILSYLSDLGVSEIYSSPILKAAKGSMHGYDVTDPTVFNPELGTEEDFNALYETRRQKNIGWLMDIVPNHMAFDCDNAFLMDVFENGEYSKYFNFFDVDWDHPYAELKGKILVPLLGEYYAEALEKKIIQVGFSNQGFSINLYNSKFPIKLDSYQKILNADLTFLEQKLGRGHEDLIRFLELTQTVKDLTAIADPAERQRLGALIKSKLWKMYTDVGMVKEYIGHVLGKFNNTDDPQSADLLDNLLLEQQFRLAYWKVGNEELNYRRFFTVNGLICLNIDRKEVFEQTHGLILKLIREKKITGLRVDHVDGIYNPISYLRRLRQEAGDIYIAVEKILDLNEDLPSTMPVQGTTGYDYLNYLNNLYVDQRNATIMEMIYGRFIEDHLSYRGLVSDNKRLFMGRHMAGDIDNLAIMFKRIFSTNREGRDLTRYGIRRAIVEIMAQFPIYRTYIHNESIQDFEKAVIKEAVAQARDLNPGQLRELDLVEKVLLLDFYPRISDEDKASWLHFVQRFQQFSGPLMAKGAEDTTFYIYNRLISLNEVGNDPSVFGVSVEQFNQYIHTRQKQWPYAMNATSTHDTKRGEDMRARINVLSELFKEWNQHLKLWHGVNKLHMSNIEDFEIPARNDEYFIYQTIIGAYPFVEGQLQEFKSRLKEYTVKSLREGKVYSSWIKPNLQYEQGCLDFIEKILDEGNTEFMKTFKPFVDKIIHYGVFNSLSQMTVKLTSPGVPDIYQGTDLWDLNLVDPDNRRPVDYQLRSAYLQEIKSQANDPDYGRRLLSSPGDGKVKLFLMYKLLNCRKLLPDLFLNGDYVPLACAGKYARNVIAFLRGHESQRMLVVAPRFFTEIDSWEDTVILIPEQEQGVWKDVLTNKTFNLSPEVPVKSLCSGFPVSVLIKMP